MHVIHEGSAKLQVCLKKSGHQLSAQDISCIVVFF
ncbi:unnamed protein product [Larinioides sclopetarius]|uniref:Uncharacterized protein n=1 Tax=Larinioides sclopetarius TaxID=280406 RepID=A0AAV1ZKS8_9ARAC